jgi:hypothetical protein
MSLGSPAFAAALRDLIVKMVRREVAQLHPPATYGVVKGFDRRALTADVLLPGATEPVVVRMGAVQPQQAGQKVRLSMVNGDPFIENVVGPAFFVGIAGRANGLQGDTPAPEAEAVDFTRSGGLMFSGLEPPTEFIGDNGDFYLQVLETGGRRLYGPKLDGVWPAPFTLSGA